MNLTARLLTLLAVISFLGGCRLFARRSATALETSRSGPSATPRDAAAIVEPLTPSPRLIVGRIIAVDAGRGFAFVELAADPPRAALADGTELIARTLELRETARLHASSYARGRTLGTRIVSGQPAPGDEVVWLAP
jgi:hypothetical protein